MFVYVHFPWKDEIAISIKSMVFNCLEKGFPRKLEIHILWKKKIHDKLVQMLFGAATDSLLKTNIKEGSEEMK